MDDYHKAIRRRIEDYLRKQADEDTIIGLAMILKIDLKPRDKTKQEVDRIQEEVFHDSDYDGESCGRS